MRDKSPSFQWYPADILASARVASLSLAEEGAYRRALDLCWLSNNGTLPGDPKELARLIGKRCKTQWAKRVLELFEPVTPGMVNPFSKSELRDTSHVFHNRLDWHKSEQVTRRVNDSNRGKAGAKARWGDAQGMQQVFSENASSNAQAMLGDSSSSSSSSSCSKIDSTRENHSTTLGEFPESEAIVPVPFFPSQPMEDRKGKPPRDWNEVWEYGVLRGITDDVCKSFYLQYESKNWIDGAGIPITNWRAKLQTWAYNQKHGNIPGRGTASGGYRKPEPPRIPGGGVKYEPPKEKPASPETVAAVVADAKRQLGITDDARPARTTQSIADALRNTKPAQ